MLLGDDTGRDFALVLFLVGQWVPGCLAKEYLELEKHFG